jgi:murein hydrolase activator
MIARRGLTILKSGHPSRGRESRVSRHLLEMLAVSVAITVGLSSGRAHAQTPDDARAKLNANKKVLDEARQREQELARDVGSLESERAKINRNLIDTAKAIQRAEGKLTQIENRLGELDAQEKLVRGSLAQNQGKIARLMGAMQRMGRNPPPVMVTRREDALEMVRSAMLLASVFPGMREQALELSEKLNEMARVMDETRKEREQLKGETTRLSDARTRLDGLLVQKRENITERQGELKQVRQAASELSQSVTDLNELITKLDKTVSEKAGIAEYDRELAEGRGQVAQAPAMPQSPPSAQPASPEARQRAGDRMAESGTPKPDTRVASANPGPLVAPKPMKPSVPFEQMNPRAW